MSLLKGLLRPLKPGTVIPILLSAALLIFAFSMTDAGKVTGAIRRIPASSLGETCLLAGMYLFLKWIQLRMLLARLGIRPPWRLLVLAFSIGEMTLPIPSGVYVQNYILRHVQGTGFARSSAATSTALVIEFFVVLSTLSVTGSPSWIWMRPAALALLLGGTMAFVGGLRLAPRLPAWLHRGRLGRGLGDLVAGMRQLATARLLLLSYLLSLTYLYLLVEAFQIVGHAVGIPSLSYHQALVIYFESLAAALLAGGIVAQLGSLELVGLGAARSWGYSPTTGLALMLGFRLVWLASVWLIAGTAALCLRRELHPKMTERNRATDSSTGRNDGSPR